MNKLRQLQRNRPALFLVLACYAIGLALLLLAQLAGLVANRVRYATGALAPAELTVEDFELVELQADGNQLFTLGADPQLILKDGDRLVENLVLELEYQRPPRSRTAFWAGRANAYSLRSMAYSHGGQGRVFYLPAAGRRHLRLDPDTVPGNLITVGRIAINQPRPFWAFFIPGAGRLVLLAVVPGLVASLLSILKQAGLKMPGRKAGGAQ